MSTFSQQESKHILRDTTDVINVTPIVVQNGRGEVGKNLAFAEASRKEACNPMIKSVNLNLFKPRM